MITCQNCTYNNYQQHIKSLYPVHPFYNTLLCFFHSRHFGVRTSSGSGFIFREDGYVLTNFHVVGSNSSVKVRLSDDRVLEGRVIAANPNLDLALVKLAATGLPSISLARSADLRTGEWVVALGAPRFLTNSVTVGVVSATDRDLGIHRGKRYIQTDAAITVSGYVCRSALDVFFVSCTFCVCVVVCDETGGRGCTQLRRDLSADDSACFIVAIEVM